MVRVAVRVLPRASWAVTVSTLVPGWRAIRLADQLVVPLAVPLPPRSFAHVTWVTPTLSAAVPRSVSRRLPVLYVAPVVGEVMATVGGVVSVWTVRVAVPVLPKASRAVTVITLVPGRSPMLLAVQLVVPLAVPLPPRAVG